MKRASQAALAVCILLAGAALWARQQSPPTSSATAKLEQRVEAYLRNYYAWGSAFQVKVEAPAPSVIPGLYKVPVVISYKGQSDHADVYVTHDGRYMIRGAVSNLLIDPFKKANEKLNAALKGHPYVGPAKACVNVVEFSDYECPHCREAHEVLKQLEKHYPQVRFTFMDFPLTQIHPWSFNAALAARCAFQENAGDYPKLRDSIFANQTKITLDNVSDTLGNLATQAGLNSGNVQACMASAATHKEVESDEALGKSLEVNSTPTIFVNGRPVVGGNGPLLNQMIEYELAKCTGGRASK
jgi:protein-disulfide isomerase